MNIPTNPLDKAKSVAKKLASKTLNNPTLSNLISNFVDTVDSTVEIANKWPKRLVILAVIVVSAAAGTIAANQRNTPTELVIRQGEPIEKAKSMAREQAGIGTGYTTTERVGGIDVGGASLDINTSVYKNPGDPKKYITIRQPTVGDNVRVAGIDGKKDGINTVYQFRVNPKPLTGYQGKPNKYDAISNAYYVYIRQNPTDPNGIRYEHSMFLRNESAPDHLQFQGDSLGVLTGVTNEAELIKAIKVLNDLMWVEGRTVILTRDDFANSPVTAYTVSVLDLKTAVIIAGQEAAQVSREEDVQKFNNIALGLTAPGGLGLGFPALWKMVGGKNSVKNALREIKQRLNKKLGGGK